MTRIYRPRGFTLVELMVVVGIVTVLIAMLLPALNRAYDTARGTACAANLRQWGMAWTEYCNDFKGSPPARGLDIVYLSKPAIPYWMGCLQNYVPWRSGLLQCPSAMTSPQPVDQTATTSSVFGSASEPWALWRKSDAMLLTSGYGYNDYWYSDQFMNTFSASFATREWIKISSAKNGQGPVLTDMAKTDSGEPAPNQWPYDLSTGQYGAGASNCNYMIISRHYKGRGINVLFPDDSVQFFPLAQVYTIPWYVGQTPNYTSGWFTSKPGYY